MLESLPRNSTGKLPRTQLQTLLSLGAACQRLNLLGFCRRRSPGFARPFPRPADRSRRCLARSGHSFAEQMLAGPALNWPCWKCQIFSPVNPEEVLTFS